MVTPPGESIALAEVFAGYDCYLVLQSWVKNELKIQHFRCSNFGARGSSQMKFCRVMYHYVEEIMWVQLLRGATS